MKKNILYLLTGIFFGIVMTKGEIVSWYRIHEMFRFESFHMYGVIGTAVLLNMLFIQWGLKKGWKNLWGEPLVAKPPLPLNVKRHLLAGTIFGLGWALPGACPGPIYVLLGIGYWVVLLILFGALLGTLTYGLIRHKLPH